MTMKFFNDASLVDDWPKAFPGIRFEFRTSKHVSTKYSSFFLLHGKEPKLPTDTECAYSKQHILTKNWLRLNGYTQNQNGFLAETSALKPCKVTKGP
ncbi:polyprotein of retroviral origin [Plakobranchus ocellatus]|uniref:Polyprotein of retroviral origin n=1 Tax=Plakobranchus ocellatus TaxID=259542 RepID=A0AAV4B5I7_9GAST|nr:polyprotein of retroviral origin [Plakobranchus ocellatus]